MAKVTGFFPASYLNRYSLQNRMESETAVVCRHCRKNVRMNELREEEGLWICQDCYEKAHFYPEPKRVSFKDDAKEARQDAEEKTGTKIYICGNCGYHLKREHFDNDRACQYCGDKGTMRIMK